MAKSVRAEMSSDRASRPAGDARRSKIEIDPIAGSIGAALLGVDLTRSIGDSLFADIHAAFLEHLVIFLPRQKPLSPTQHGAFAALFGEIDYEPFSYPYKTPTVPDHPEILINIKEASDRSFNVGGSWHADVTYRERPHKAAVLYAKEAPRFGGDTMFANQYLAWESLSEGMREMLAHRKAVHSSRMVYGGESARFPSVSRDEAPRSEHRSFTASLHARAEGLASENEHPVARTHPETRRRSLYVNRGFTYCFAHMSVEESRPLLELLWQHAERAEFTCRWRWSVNDVAVWDNRCVLHYALNDYSGNRREMHRISIHEETRPC